jgi:hypothetical protein
MLREGWYKLGKDSDSFKHGQYAITGYSTTKPL